MANYLPKGREHMMELGSKGGVASGVTRHKNKVARVLGIPPVPAELTKRPNLAGGSHKYDWPCPYCRRMNSIKRQACGKCGRTPENGRMTRHARQVRQKEHLVEHYLRKVGLASPPDQDVEESE